MNVLLVEDTRTNLLIIRRYLRQMGHDVITAEDGYQAVQSFLACRPDMILMDVNMPRMDGYQAAEQIRRHCPDDWVPIIFLSAMIEDEDVARGIAAGGDDYLSKPVRPLVLQAKIGAMQRIASMRSTIQQYADSLAKLHQTQQEEIQLARHVFDRMTRVDRLDNDWLKIISRPSSSFSGDVIAAARTPAGDFHVMLGDATGHGLSAGLTIMPATDIFYGLTEAGRDLSYIVTRLNRRMRDILPVGRFVALVMVAIKEHQSELQIWNGGCPPAYLIDQRGDLLAQFRAANLPLGVSVDEFEPVIETVGFEKYDGLRLYLHSDGLSDAENPLGERFGMDKKVHLLCRTKCEQRLDTLMQSVDEHLQGIPAQDDISLIEINTVGH